MDYAPLRGLLNAARKEAADIGLWTIAAVIDELIGDVDFLEAVEPDADTRP